MARLLPRVPLPGAAARLYVWLAESKAHPQDYEAAIACCDRAIARRPSLASAYLRRARLHILRGNWRRGVADLESALPRLAPPGGQSPPRRVREPLLYCHENLAQWLAADGRPEAALEHYNAAISLEPDRAVLYLRRGECHDTLGRPAQAEADYRTALAAGLSGGDLPSAYRALGRLRACEGRVEQAVAHYYASLAPSDPPAEGSAFDLVRMVQAHDALAEDVVNWYGKMDVARLVYRHKLDLQRRLAPSDPLGASRVLVLPDDWVRNIGHMGAIDGVLKMIRLGWRSWRYVVLLAPPGGTANRHYLTCLQEHVTVVTDPTLCASLAPLAAAFGFRVAHGLYPPASELLYFYEAIGRIQQEWEAQSRPPLFAVSDADTRRGRDALEKMGAPRDAWFVCLHVRESGFHKAGDSRHQAHRDADVLDYLPAIRQITERGGWVVRMGDPTMTPLPPMERVIDYAHSPGKADWLDVFLCGRCRFFVGLASGLSQVAVGFGVPCVYVNWISNVLPPFSAKDVFIPKMFRREADGRFLSFAEMFDPAYQYLNSNNYLILRRGLASVPNEPADLRDAVAEMLDQLDGTCAYSEEDRRLQGRLDEVMAAFGHKGYCRMAKAFLSKNRRLLSEVSPSSRDQAAA